MLKSNRDSNWPTGYSDHVSHSKFCENINWANISALKILIDLVLQNRTTQ